MTRKMSPRLFWSLKVLWRLSGHIFSVFTNPLWWGEGLFKGRSAVAKVKYVFEKLLDARKVSI
jgi:hypothetical protein